MLVNLTEFVEPVEENNYCWQNRDVHWLRLVAVGAWHFSGSLIARPNDGTAPVA